VRPDLRDDALERVVKAWAALPSALKSARFDGAPDVEMNEHVVGLGRYDRTLTVLFTDEVLDEEDEENDDDE
jgi:hypothetical protein